MGEPTAAPEQSTRTVSIGGSVNRAEEEEILAAFRQAGFAVKSRAIRALLLSFARSTKVRDAVAEFIRDNLDLLAA